MGMRRGFLPRALILIAFFGVTAIGLYIILNAFKGSEKTNGSQIQNNWINDANTPEGERLSSVVLEGSSQRRHNNKDPRNQLKEKIVHLDLKGMPYRVEAYVDLFLFLRHIGVTGILIEYEDMFPFHGKLQSIANKEAYTKEDIKRILSFAKNSQLQVIPLIQTFGHLEFVLKLEQYVHLREVRRYPQVICPSNDQSVVLIKEMIDQVMELHAGIKYLHIGSDEVYHIGVCPICQDRMSKLKMDVGQLFLQHVKLTAKYVINKYHVQPLMWDDEFRKLDAKTIKKSGIGELVELVVWNYRPDVENQLEMSIWQKYSSLFKTVWIGSAFKGANKPNSMIVDETLYLSNHFSWVNTMENVGNLVSFKGIFLTGWQRYDHFSVLCELLPSAIPSLFACMSYLTGSGSSSMKTILSNTSSDLHCRSELNFCAFPGSRAYQSLKQFEQFKEAFLRLKEKNIFLGWAQDINLKLQFSNPSHVEQILQDVLNLNMEFDRCQEDLYASFTTIYPSSSVEEWMMTNVDSYSEEIKSLKITLAKILENNVFPVRPLNLKAQFNSSKDTLSSDSL